jgi:hypothetical protein
VLEDSK